MEIRLISWGVPPWGEGQGGWLLHVNVKFFIDRHDKRRHAETAFAQENKKNHNPNHEIGQNERTYLCQGSQADEFMKLGILALCAGIFSLWIHGIPNLWTAWDLGAVIIFRFRHLGIV